MGDRAQVKFIYNDKDLHELYFYTHWGGSELEDTVKSAIRRGEGRWFDDEYLARIIFCEMVMGDVMGETGFGIGFSEHGDLQHPVIIVDCFNQTVNLESGEVVTFESLKRKNENR